MHHLNCLVLESMLHALEGKLDQATLVDAFSNSSEECIFIFETFSLSCRFINGEIYFFTSEAAMNKSRLYKPQFRELHSQKIAQTEPNPFERSFSLLFGNGSRLFFKCHGRKSNILLFQGDENPETFRKNIELDETARFETLYRNISPAYDAKAVQDEKLFKSLYPYLPSEIRPELVNLQSTEFESILLACRHSQSLRFNEETLSISLIPHAQKNDFLHQLNLFGAYASRELIFISLRNRLLNDCSKALSDKQHFLESNVSALKNLSEKRPDSEIGHIILANIHLIKPETKEAKVMDIYRQEDITVQLDPKLNAVENAERYFRKEKGLPHKLELLRNKISESQVAVEKLQRQLSIISEAKDLKSLKPLLKEQKTQENEEQLPYRRFNVEQYEVLVGKHAESNEKLLNYFSDKNDIWLHAKDVSGSHVIIKSHGKSAVPDQVIEKAASLAAYYSKNRKQNLVTVTHTLRKFVRKIKGAEKGKVTVSNEKTVLVSPANPDNFQ